MSACHFAAADSLPGKAGNPCGGALATPTSTWVSDPLTFPMDTSPPVVKSIAGAKAKAKGRPAGCKVERELRRNMDDQSTQGPQMTRVGAAQWARERRREQLNARHTSLATTTIDTHPRLTSEQQQAVNYYLLDGMSVSIAAMEKITGAASAFLAQVAPITALELMEIYEDEFHALVQSVAADVGGG